MEARSSESTSEMAREASESGFCARASRSSVVLTLCSIYVVFTPLMILEAPLLI